MVVSLYPVFSCLFLCLFVDSGGVEVSDCIKNDWELNELAQEYADDIRKDVEQYGGDFSDVTPRS